MGVVGDSNGVCWVYKVALVFVILIEDFGESGLRGPFFTFLKLLELYTEFRRLTMRT